MGHGTNGAVANASPILVSVGYVLQDEQLPSRPPGAPGFFSPALSIQSPARLLQSLTTGTHGARFAVFVQQLITWPSKPSLPGTFVQLSPSGPFSPSPSGPKPEEPRLPHDLRVWSFHR
jgi:hypothetical protein